MLLVELVTNVRQIVVLIHYVLQHRRPAIDRFVFQIVDGVRGAGTLLAFLSFTATVFAAAVALLIRTRIAVKYVREQFLLGLRIVKRGRLLITTAARVFFLFFFLGAAILALAVELFVNLLEMLVNRYLRGSGLLQIIFKHFRLYPFFFLVLVVVGIFAFRKGRSLINFVPRLRKELLFFQLLH